MLEIEQASPFRVRAYRSAAQTIATLPRPVTDLLDEGEDWKGWVKRPKARS